MRILKYFFVGGFAAVVDVGLFSLFSGLLGWPWIPVSIFTFVLATLINYFLSIKFVFQSGIRHKQQIELCAVFVVSGVALLVNQVILYTAIELFHWHLIVSKILATATVFFWNYFGRSRFVF